MPIWKYYENDILVDFADSKTTSYTSKKLEEVWQKNIDENQNYMADFKGRQIVNVSNIPNATTIANIFSQKNGGPDLQLKITVLIPPMSIMLINKVDVKVATIIKLSGENALQSYLEQFVIKVTRIE